MNTRLLISILSLSLSLPSLSPPRSLFPLPLPSSLPPSLPPSLSQIDAVAVLHHPNIVRLLGFCSEHSPAVELVEQILVFEFVPNGDLQTFLLKRKRALRSRPSFKNIHLLLGLGLMLQCFSSELDVTYLTLQSTYEALNRRDFGSPLVSSSFHVFALPYMNPHVPLKTPQK